MPSRNGAAIVVFPGRGGRPRRARGCSSRHGYGVLVLDRRGEGESDGDFNSLGYGGVPDVLAAARYLRDASRRPRRPRRRAGPLGRRRAAARGRRAVDRACAPSSPRARACARTASSSTRRAAVTGRRFPFWVVTSAATAVFGNAAIPPGLTSLTPGSAPAPLFLIWATNGNAEEVNAPYLDAAGEPKQGWEIPESEHVGGLAARPAEYERRVVEFFDRALGV